MKRLSRPNAKNLFFNKVPLIFKIRRLGLYFEVKLNKLEFKNTKTYYFDKACDYIINLPEVKEQTKDISLNIRDVEFFLGDETDELHFEQR